MALGEEIPFKAYVGNATALTFPTLFSYTDTTDVKVYLNNVLQSTGFTVSNNEVTFETAPGQDVAILLLRTTPIDQPIPFEDPQKTTLAEVERVSDRGIRILQEASDSIDRSVKAAPGETPPSGSIFQLPNTTMGQGASGDLISRTVPQELAHLGITDQGVLSSTVAATNTLTIYTDPNVGPITLVIGGVNVVFPSSATYNQDGAAVAIANIINAGDFTVTAAASGPYVVVSAKLPGGDGNGITCSISVGAAYGTWANATTTGGTLSGVVLSGIAQDLSFTQKEQAQRNLGIYGAPLIVQGPGIDPTGATPSSDGLNAFFTANKRGEFYIPEGFYWINKPVKLYESANYRGAGSTPYQPTGHVAGTTDPSGTVFFCKESTVYPWVTDVNGDRTMFISETWTLRGSDDADDAANYWMHNFAFTNCGIDGNKVADYGFKIYQMGEVGHITDCTIQDCRQAGVFATGSHAPFTMRNCTVLGPGEFEADPATSPKTYIHPHPYTGLHFGKHPTLGGNAGEVRLIGLSGDKNNGGILRISGGHHVTAFGSKFENNSFKTILFDQQGLGGNIGKGGGAASIALVGGFSQDPTSQYKTSEEIIRIEEGVTPSITMNNFNFTQGVNSAEYGDGVGTNDRNPPVQFYDSNGQFYTPALIRTIGEPKSYTGDGTTTQFNTVHSDVDVYLGSNPPVLQTTGYSVSNSQVIFVTAPASGVAIYIWSEIVTPTINSVGSVRQPFLSFGPGMNTFHSNIQLGKGNSLYATRYDNETTGPVLSLRSDNIVGLKAFTSAGVALIDDQSQMRIKANRNGIGFQGASPFAKPTISGSATSTDRIGDILTALHNYGLINNTIT
jgi:hypothetical protein